MDRFALLVDAGYFFAAGGEAAFGHQVVRQNLRFSEPTSALNDLVEEAAALCNDLPILRTYWYDAVPGVKHVTSAQAELARLASLKLRLGVLNSHGKQKGVDALIVTDLLELARKRAITDAVVVSGDEDIRVGVQLAQSYGVRVHLLGAGDISSNMSPALQHEADTVQVLKDSWFTKHFDERVSAPSVPRLDDLESESAGSVGASGGSTTRRLEMPVIPGETLEQAAIRVASALLKNCDRRDLEQLKAQLEVGQGVPPEYDRPIIATVAHVLGGKRLSPDECRSIRLSFMAIVEERLT